ncbi:aldo/keto reductase [Cuneatibacter sp. NSJ-177]|uniref:aldo/keto reductase n=1 Tax=Cuneatibacter sp. NSJ-177 TaxID=2931401 RepID=UPI001FCF9E09|nr:aldo/keto reductase [Cuneatibacter sp. NSJ-177]MCJ7834238.1 aldo/keto reductase [Cuneatibacter sp. NSJ-177]
MKLIPFGASGLSVPAIAAGCMRINAVTKKEAGRLIHTALDAGVNFFDHAAVYGKEAGECESIFGSLLTPSLREQMILQTKCGIHKNTGVYDFSKEHILKSAEDSLRRLHTDYLDVLLLHRPDALMEPEEIAEAFDRLHRSGKVRFFGVSNQNTMQMALLEKYLRQPLITNQLQVSIAHPAIIAQGMNVNTMKPYAPDRDGGVLNYCRLKDITIQAWSPFQYGFFGGVFFDRERFPKLNEAIDRIAETHHTSNTAVATAWILRHPAQMQVISGTMKPERFLAMCQATDFVLSREEWYELYYLGAEIYEASQPPRP